MDEGKALVIKKSELNGLRSARIVYVADGLSKKVRVDRGRGS